MDDGVDTNYNDINISNWYDDVHNGCGRWYEVGNCVNDADSTT